MITSGPVSRRVSWFGGLLTVLIPSSGLALPSGPFQASDRFVDAPWASGMAREIQTLKKRFRGRMAVYVSDPYRGYVFRYRDDVPMYLASVVKAAFMIEIFRQREQGKLSFDDRIEYTAERIRDGAPRVNKLEIGTKIKIGQLLDWMMRSSDNAASDMLAERAGLSNVHRGLIEEGLQGFTGLTLLLDVRRGIYRNLNVAADDLTAKEVRTIRWTPIWQPQVNRLNQMLGLPRGTVTKEKLHAAYQRYYETRANSAPMRTLGLMYEKMIRGELISPAASQEMLKLMSNARTSTHRLLGRLPPGTKVIHKTGSQFMRLCDTGIIFLPDQKPLVVCACMEEGLVPQSEANVARIARRAYDLALRDHRKRP